ncbi:hypothetical protein TNCT_165231 [Trichonephila clavata]|uniref:Uncharacterized protein n=1 Tax=Trichonephila clavata TaxID=2740835 RepID=A0A8X6F8Q4_TRICU|nr:hypothetical protein TNCT_165231 [Trichonephila clavata]
MTKEKYRVLELFSGIGGMRFSFDASGIPYEIVAAIDVNPVVNDIYCHNFSSCGHSQKNILSFTTTEIESMNLDIITMSPPCQPFTRVGLKKDIQDARSSSFLHILDILNHLHRKPMYLLIENVQGFENSQARNVLIETIKKSGYRYQEFLLTPQDFGIPNSRLRYYLIAKVKSARFSFAESQQVLRSFPDTISSWKFHCGKCQLMTIGKDNFCPLKHFLEERSTEYFESYLVPDSVLLKYWSVFDIVREESHNSCCFTKAYQRYAQGTGSILLSCRYSDVDSIFEKVMKSDNVETQLFLLRTLKLRYFTPKEIANLMCFPDNFSFPPTVNVKQMYKSLVSLMTNKFFITEKFVWCKIDIHVLH